MASVKKILKLTLWTACLSVGWADAKPIEQGTLKTPVDGDGYFKYGIYQEDSNPRPYLTCVTEGSCPIRTAKTRADAHEPSKTVAPTIAQVPKNQSMGKIHFGFASSKLSSEEVNVLSRLVTSLRGRSEVHLRAYTDPVGGVNSKSNNTLARKRANSVKTYLVGHGVKGRFFIEYNPSCCNKQGVTANSSDVERREMRVVDIS